MKKVEMDGDCRITTVWQPHENRLYVEQDSSVAEKRIAARNARLRQQEQTGKGNVRMHLQMSHQDYVQLCQQFPKLRTGSSKQRRKIWMKIAKKRPDLVAMEFKQRLFAAGVRNAG